MRCQIVLTAIALLVATVGSSMAADSEQEPQGFFVAPLTTDVHHTVVAKQADVYADVNCSALLDGKKFHSASPLLPQFESELKRFATGDAARLKLVLRYLSSSEPDEEAKRAIKGKLTSLARAAGFQKVSTTQMITSATWEETRQPLRGLHESQIASEPIVEDSLIKAYPVRTKLSKFVLGDADCVVEIKQPFDGRQAELSASLRASIEQAVRSLDLGTEKGTLLYRVTSTAAGQKPIEQIFNSQPPVQVPPDLNDSSLKAFFEQRAAEYKPSPAMKMALELGFERIKYAHSPGGGAPEKLLGKSVPDFSLKTLQGEPLELRKFLRGRPALVSFWGVACGPCCQEAPHLTRMHSKYAQKFAIVAVNGYDESQEVVARFVEQAKLQHPIVLSGGSVADKNYFVGAYPTTFWISPDGTVEDYEVGFESEAALEERIKKAIADR